MTPVSVDVCILGGGLTGLAAALAFRQAGLSVLVIERRTEPGDSNRGDWLSAKSLALLKKLGVSFERRPFIEITRIRVELGSRSVASRKLGKDAGISIAAVQLEGALRDAAKAAGVDLRLGWQVQGLTTNPTKTRVTGVTALCGADFGVFEAKFVIGADGRTSMVRDALGLKLRTLPKTSELLACEADLAAVSPTLPDSIIFGVGKLGGGHTAPLTTRRVRVVSVTGVGESEALARKTPLVLSQELPARTPLPLGAAIDPGRLRGYDQTAVGHVPNYAAAGAVCIGEAAHPSPAPFGGILMALLDVEALARLVAPAIKEGEKGIDKGLAKFELARWPDNEKRLVRARAALAWLAPLSSLKVLLLRTPLARFLLRAVLASE